MTTQYYLRFNQNHKHLGLFVSDNFSINYKLMKTDQVKNHQTLSLMLQLSMI